MVSLEKARIIDLQNQLAKKVKELEKFLEKLFGKYPKVTFWTHALYHHGWIRITFQEKPTEEQLEQLKQKLEEEFGKLDRPELFQCYKNVNKPRIDNFEFFSYLKENLSSL